MSPHPCARVVIARDRNCLLHAAFTEGCKPSCSHCSVYNRLFTSIGAGLMALGVLVRTVSYFYYFSCGTWEFQPTHQRSRLSHSFPHRAKASTDSWAAWVEAVLEITRSLHIQLFVFPRKTRRSHRLLVISAHIERGTHSMKGLKNTQSMAAACLELSPVILMKALVWFGRMCHHLPRAEQEPSGLKTALGFVGSESL